MLDVEHVVINHSICSRVETCTDKKLPVVLQRGDSDKSAGEGCKTGSPKISTTNDHENQIASMQCSSAVNLLVGTLQTAENAQLRQPECTKLARKVTASNAELGPPVVYFTENRILGVHVMTFGEIHLDASAPWRRKPELR